MNYPATELLSNSIVRARPGAAAAGRPRPGDLLQPGARFVG